MRTFELTEEQLKKFNKWKKKNNFKSEDAGAVGGAFTFKFIPTGIGTITKVQYMEDGPELDLTDENEFS